MQLSTFTMLPSYVWFFAIAFPNPGYSQGETENEYIDFSSTEANPNNDESHLVGRSFALLEKRIHSYIDYGRRWQMAVISNKSRFLEEVDEYLTRLPRNATKMVISSSRDVCHCEGRWMTPCPIRCLYSCYVKNTDSYTINNGWRHEDDCRGIQMHDCRCHEHSSTSCYENQLLNCFNQTTEYVQADKSCKQYSVNKPNLVRSYELILNLLMEPLKMYFRSLESRLSFLKQATFTINSLSNIAGPKCTDFQDSTECTPGIDQLISEEETIYAQMRTNFFLELIKIQSKIQTASMKVEKLKQGTIDSINRSIKGYSCCLKSLDFAIDDYDCRDITSPYPTQLSDSECECDPLGSYGPTCNSEGSCSCRPHFDGKLCNRCKDGFYNHPLCEGTSTRSTEIGSTEISFRRNSYVELPGHLTQQWLPDDPVSISMTIQTEEPIGLIFWQGTDEQYMSIGVQEGYIEAEVDDNDNPLTIRSRGKVDDARPHNVIVTRKASDLEITLDGITVASTNGQPPRKMPSRESIFIGGLADPWTMTRGRWKETFVGCILRLRINDGEALDFSKHLVSGRNVSSCLSHTDKNETK